MNRSRRDHPLTRDELLDAALAIVDAEGLPALTMRHLADVVGVEAMSLYHHAPSKEVLLDWTLDRMRSEMRLPEPLPDDWRDVLEAIFGEYRRVIVAHPNLLPLAGRRTGGERASGLQYLLDQGFTAEDAIDLYQSLVAFTLGYSMLGAQAGETRWPGMPDEIAERLGEWRVDTFRRSLRVLIDAYEGRRRPGP